MLPLYVVTGAAGHLGGTIVRLLSLAGAEVRALILPSEQEIEARGVRSIRGDVREIDSLRPLFEGADGRDVIVRIRPGGGRPCRAMSRPGVGGPCWI